MCKSESVCERTIGPLGTLAKLVPIIMQNSTLVALEKSHLRFFGKLPIKLFTFLTWANVCKRYIGYFEPTQLIPEVL